jgi:plastocyanin
LVGYKSKNGKDYYKEIRNLLLILLIKNMNKKIIIAVVVIIIIVAVVWILYANMNSNVYNNSNTVSQNTNMTNVATTTSTGEIVKPKIYNVSIKNFAFNPNTLTVNKGDTVFWTNNDPMPHQVVADGIKGPVMSNGQSYSFTFDTVGTVNYHCNIHPGMLGTVIVQ